MAESGLVLWGVGTSRALRIHWMFQEFGLDYVCRPVQSRTGETMSSEYLALNPRHKIPVLQHGSLVLTESAAILGYIAEAFEAPAGFHVPRDAAGRARLNEWCYFIMTELDAHGLYLIRRHGDLRHIYGAAPEAVASAQEYVTEHMTAMAGRVAAGGRYLLGDEFSVADILLTTCLPWARHCGIDLPDAYVAYEARIDERPAYRRAQEINVPEAWS